MEAICSSETLVTIYKSARRHKTEDYNPRRKIVHSKLHFLPQDTKYPKDG
jgi:hypothetical protein